MASLATKAAKRLVSQHAKQYEPQDPFYETWVDASGKQKRRKRPPPPGLTKKEAQLLRKIGRRAHYLDKGFEICGLRFGWTAIIGLIPGAGDAADASLNYFLVLRPAKKGLDLPPWLVRRMFTNNVISAGVGLIPIAGDIALAVWKANSRNWKLVEEYLRLLGEEHIAAGLTGLTPEAPPLPGGLASDANVASAKPHPAQPAAKKLVKDYSDSQLASGGANTGAAAAATTTPATKTSAAPPYSSAAAAAPTTPATNGQAAKPATSSTTADTKTAPSQAKKRFWQK